MYFSLTTQSAAGRSLFTCMHCNVRSVLLVFAFAVFCTGLQGQVIEERFGKNRVQYHDDFDNWFRYESDNFLTFWYGKSRNVAHAAIEFAELDFKEIHGVLEHRINDRIELIVYTDPTDMKQTNIGLGEFFMPEEGSTFRVFENKIFVCFTGDHNELRRQVREGIAEVYINALLFGSNLQEIVQNAVQASLPDWYKAGIISFVGSSWSADFDRRFREAFLHKRKKYDDFERMARDFPDLAGHSLWFYIAETYGAGAISNLLYITRINRSLDNSFFYVLGVGYEQVIRDWKFFFRKKYLNEELTEAPPKEESVRLKRRGKIAVQKLELSPDGNRLAFVQNDMGRWFLYLMEASGKRRKLLAKRGVRNRHQMEDPNYPLIAWSPDGSRLTMVYERRDVIQLREIDLEGNVLREQTVAPQIQRVYSLDYFDADSYVLSATDNGFANLFRYYPATRQFDKVTADFYDDLEAKTGDYMGQRGVYFASNRPAGQRYAERIDSILPLGSFDIFWLDMKSVESVPQQITNTPVLSERNPQYDRGRLYFMEESRDWRQRAVVAPGDSSEARGSYDTDKSTVLHFSRRNGQVALHRLAGGRSHIQWTADLRPELSGEPAGDGDTADAVPAPPVPEAQPLKLKPSATVRFQSSYDDFSREIKEQKPATLIKAPSPRIVTPQGVEIRAPHQFKPIQAVPYRLSFRVDELLTDLDNTPFFQGLTMYQNDPDINTGQGSFSGFQPGIAPPPLGILFKGTVKDLFEDYVIEGAARYPTSFSGSEYFLTFHNRKGRLDKSFSAYRRVLKDNEETGFFTTVRKEYTTLMGIAEFRYPLDIYTSLRGTATLRNDRFSYSITDPTTLELPDNNEQRIGARVEYVFDNTIDLGINLMQGSRYKFFAEAVKRFELQLRQPASLNFDKGFMMILGLDARHYERILGKSIFATRLAGATSFGSEKVLYQMGGINNWLFPDFSGQIPYPNADEFAYQQLALQMRGFGLNIRNGSSFAVWNTELRVPLFQYFSKGKIRMSFFRNFQVTGFLDVGTAWQGVSPFDRQNPLNTLKLSNPSVELEVNFYRDPIVVGYGFGARTTIFGYFLRMDYGWGVDTKVTGDPMLYLSLGTDF